MCNAWNHWPGCDCGFGGQGHSAGGFAGGPRVRYLRETRLGFGSTGGRFGSSSMTDLAAELGHSLVFPVLCKYCGAPVYLFAAPDGGFAVFDHLGPPWPKHWCRQLSQTRTIDCSFPEPGSTRYTLPVPDSAQFRLRPNGSRLSGIVVAVASRDHPRRKDPLWAIDVFDGKSLYRVQVGVQFSLGSYIRGEVDVVPDVGTFLQNPAQFLPPGYSEPAEPGAEVDPRPPTGD